MIGIGKKPSGVLKVGKLPVSIIKLIESPIFGDPYARTGMYILAQHIAHEACRLQWESDNSWGRLHGGNYPLVVEKPND